jgi:hypothetical protein
MDRKMPRKSRVAGKVKEYNINDISLPENHALWARSFKANQSYSHWMKGFSISTIAFAINSTRPP